MSRQFIRRDNFNTIKNYRCRPFFASSTDHSRLLAEAEVYCLPTSENIKQFVLVARGMDYHTVAKVPQLHLARVFLDKNTIYGAKVINRTLGNLTDVCGKLVDHALQEAGSDAQARSTLHGLSGWVLEGLQKADSSEILSGLTEAERQAITEIARYTEKRHGVYEDAKEIWAKLAREFLEHKLSSEALLYQSKGATLVNVEHGLDTSDFASTCGTAMAMFSFSRKP